MQNEIENKTKKKICVITDINGIYGLGHFTRMKFIANKLNFFYDFIFSSINNESELFFKSNLNLNIETCKFDEIKKINPYLIIVDSREVGKKYIKRLKKISPVIIVDSVGEERNFADIVIEMLPNLDDSDFVNIKPFSSTILNSNIKPRYDNEAPILVYLGFNNDLKNKAFEIISKIENKKFVFIESQNESENIISKKFSPDIFENPYSAVITYFGLTAFECIEAKIPVILLSPTKYHNDLGEKCGDIFFNLGFFEDINIEEAFNKIKNFLFDFDLQNEYKEKSKNIDTEKSIERIKIIIDNIEDFKNIECVFCKSKNIEIKNRNAESNLYKCKKCNSLFRKYFLPVSTDYSSKYFIEDYKNQYGKTYEEDEENLKALAKNRLEIIKSVKPAGKILDLGSAMGFFLKEASSNGYETEGIEISEYAANYCVNNLNLNVHNISLLDFEYKEKEYDIITAWYVLEHIYDFEKLLKNILFSLKDGGIFAFAMPNGNGISGRHNKNYFKIVPSDHAFETNPKALDNFLKNYSLKRAHLKNKSVYYDRFCDIFNLKFLKENKTSKKLYNLFAEKYNLGDTFECVYKKIR